MQIKEQSETQVIPQRLPQPEQVGSGRMKWMFLEPPTTFLTSGIVAPLLHFLPNAFHLLLPEFSFIPF